MMAAGEPQFTTLLCTRLVPGSIDGTVLVLSTDDISLPTMMC